MNYYRRFMGDYLRDTGHLSLTEHGAYTLLLDHYYATRGNIPPDLASLYRLCRATTPAEQRAVASVAAQYFPMVDGARFNPRAALEIGSHETFSASQRDKGIKGAAKRWNDRNPSENNSRPMAGANGPGMAAEMAGAMAGATRAAVASTSTSTSIGTSVPLTSSPDTPRARIRKAKNGHADSEREREKPAAIAKRRHDPKASAALARVGMRPKASP